MCLLSSSNSFDRARRTAACIFESLQKYLSLCRPPDTVYSGSLLFNRLKLILQLKRDIIISVNCYWVNWRLNGGSEGPATIKMLIKATWRLLEDKFCGARPAVAPTREF
jgi:hypothetical protein